MSAIAMASPLSNKINMQDPDSTSSPHPPRKAQPKGARRNQNAVQQNQAALSDSNISGSNTPKPKKTPRQKQQGDRAASVAVSTNRPGQDYAQSQRARPASMAAQQPNISATPQKVAAYAGPTFHASPAPSSLPVPRFFSKSVPGTGQEVGLQARMEKEEEKSDSSDNGAARLAPPSRSLQQSPLDLFFKADREERAKKQNGPSSVLGSDTPERPQMPAPATSGKDMFMMELDESDSPVAKRGQKLAPPGPRRMTSERSRTAPENVPTLSQDEAQRAAYTKSLKDLLKLPSDNASQRPPATTQPPFDANQGSPYSQHRASPAPATPQNSNGSQSQHDLHYGNRNLSPLFQAARIDSPTRPSQLRQQIQPFPDIGSPSTRASEHYRPQNDPSAIARAYLQQQASGYQNQASPSHNQYPPPGPPPGFSQQEQQHQHQQQSASFPSFPSSGHHQHGASGFQHQHQQQPNSTGSPDVKSMEDNLRRMLKLM